MLDSARPRDGIETSPRWHTLAATDVCDSLASDSTRGLSADEAAQRLERDGPNRLVEARGRTPLRMVLSQFADLMVVVLIVAAVVSGILGEPIDTIAIAVILVLNAVIGAVQEFRAERAIAALRELAAPLASVLRDGRVISVAADELVVGDVLRLEAGGVVGADVRLFDATDLAIDESPLTGESQPVDKTTAALDDETLGPGDRTNGAYRGTLVTRGHGAGVVVATGMDTELGRIAGLLESATAVRTPLQRRLARFGRSLALVVLAICALVFGLGVARGEDPMLMFLTAVSLAVAAIPEALPAVVTVSLAIGARRMARRNALVRRLPAVETLGSVTFACADKTGTLTQNHMAVGAVVTADGRQEPELGDDEGMADLARAFALNNDATEDSDGGVHGDPTETALYEAAREAGIEPAVLHERLPRLAEVAFDGERRRMTTVHPDADGGSLVIVKGSPEVILERCIDARIVDDQPFDPERLADVADGLARRGFRVLAFALQRRVTVPERVRADELERDLTFVGFAGLVDPPRPGAHDAVRECRSAGITPVMITGDHPGTALAIASELAIATSPDDVATGAELDRLAPGARDERLRTARVFARVTPEQKIDVVRALQADGQFVAMTGDGVNDAPALKRAEIGIAMGQRGTEVAREAADMVLLDDDFSTVVAAVREGRRVYDNVRKFVRYTMTSNAGEIWTLLLAPLLGLPIPLTPIQILWINLVTDGLPGLALATEPAEADVMRRPPRRPNESIFARGLGAHVLWVGLLIGALSIAGQHWAVTTGSANWQSVVFTVLTFSQLAHALVIRSERSSLFRLGLGSNPWLLFAVAATVLLQLAVVYAPPLQAVFGTTGLAPAELGLCFALPLVLFAAGELEKLSLRRREAAVRGRRA